MSVLVGWWRVKSR